MQTTLLRQCRPTQPAFGNCWKTSSIKSICVRRQASKGFGSSTESKKAEDTTTSTKPSQEAAIEALEARMKRRRAERIEAKVKVESATVEAVQGTQPLTKEQQAEGTFVSGMLFLFGLVILEGLVIAGSGFLPDDWDAFVQDSLYPNYTGTVGLFLAASTAYGLWKIGKLPLPFLGNPPPPPKE